MSFLPLNAPHCKFNTIFIQCCYSTAQLQQYCCLAYLKSAGWACDGKTIHNSAAAGALCACNGCDRHSLD
jgi:hypothetical protein